jgi:transposase
VASLTLRSGRNLKRKTARAMLTMSHYMYRQRLQWASSRYAGRHVFETEEPGTSKTCTSCGFWHANLQLNDKTFVCPKCHLSVDRDIAGARNNFFAAYGNAVGIGWDGASN